MQAHILIVDDDPGLRELLVDYLGQNGFEARAVPDGAALWSSLAAGPADLLILDLMLPGDDGLELCRQLRAGDERWRTLPVIMLTARGEETDRIVGLEIGADDYLPKPFNPRELLARIRGLLRRSRMVREQQGQQGEEAGQGLCFRFAGWLLDPDAHTLTAPDGEVHTLGGADTRLLQALAAQPGRALSRDRIMDITRGRDASPYDRSIDVQVSRLRRLLGDDAREQRIIRTLRNEGYLMACDVERVN
ncbi:winged helix family two component transcriptional regulator [Alkalispirillum mobile]|uniref:Winged helix family two component transcriptional regulator n=1 Tax=Alkalispirillum mobile TaxID=85925 RepID=A0A498C3B3_9GAMM|nr:response regulator [Alkalispirillum mobile]RLK50115.1 winged helix family two component transcriptional regulator [Alkalispirillum mobile]